MREIILKTDDLSSVSIDPAKTIFWVGAGIGGVEPCSLPLGNGLTDAVLEAALGSENKEKLLHIWNGKISRIKHSVKNNTWKLPPARKAEGERPRLEFVIGEIHKMDMEFSEITFEKKENRTAYARCSVVKSLKYFADAQPNRYHYSLADFAHRGAVMITTNFDVCIEKALGLKDSQMTAVDAGGVMAVEYAPAKYVYHIHGIATDENIEENLGATLTNVTRSLPGQFAGMLCRWFEEGYTIVFIGYSGADFFDVKPFFEELGEKRYPGKAVYLHYCSDGAVKDAMAAEKEYRYLLAPFREQVICYGITEDFQEKLAARNGIAVTRFTVSAVKGGAFEHTKKFFSDYLSSCTVENREKYWFINMFRIASQLNINMKWFYTDWAERLAVICNDWKEDAGGRRTLLKMILDPIDINRCIVDDISYNNWHSTNPLYLMIAQEFSEIYSQRGSENAVQYFDPSGPVRDEVIRKYVKEACGILEREEEKNRESVAVESCVVHYLCGRNTNRLFKIWLLKPWKRRETEKQLQVILEYIDSLLEYPCNSFFYMTYYLTLMRKKHLINAILNRGGGHRPPGDVYYGKTRIYGNVQAEWDICMEIPNLYDAGKTLRGIQHQYICMMAKGRLVSPWNLWQLYRIEREILILRND